MGNNSWDHHTETGRAEVALTDDQIKITQTKK